MLALLALLVPMGLGSAVSPMMLSEQVVLLTRPQGRPAAAAYALGTITVSTLFVVLVLFLGTRLQLPRTLHLDAALDVWVGIALLVVAGVLLLWSRRHPHVRRAEPKVRLGRAAAYGFGLFAMATNFTSLALVLPAAKEVAASSVAVPGKVVAALVVVALSTLPAWAPSVLVRWAPDRSTELLRTAQGLIDRHGAAVVRFALAGVGAFLLVRGLYRLENLPLPT